LLDVQHRLNRYLSTSKGAETSEDPGEISSEERETLKSRSNRAGLVAGVNEAGDGWGMIVKFVLAQAVVGICVIMVRRWLRKRKHDKLL
jgi:hypothetical protein